MYLCCQIVKKKKFHILNYVHSHITIIIITVSNLHKAVYDLSLDCAVCLSVFDPWLWLLNLVLT